MRYVQYPIIFLIFFSSTTYADLYVKCGESKTFNIGGKYTFGKGTAIRKTKEAACEAAIELARNDVIVSKRDNGKTIYGSVHCLPKLCTPGGYKYKCKKTFSAVEEVETEIENSTFKIPMGCYLGAVSIHRTVHQNYKCEVPINCRPRTKLKASCGKCCRQTGTPDVPDVKQSSMEQ